MRRLLVFGVLILGIASSARGARAQSPFSGASTSSTSAGPLAPMSTPDTSSRPPQPEPRPEAIRLTIAPEWGYRSFRDHETSSTDKRYTAAGIPVASLRLELYPFAFISPAPEVARDFGLTIGYSRAFWLESRDIDTDSTVGTEWYQFNFGLRYRILGGNNPLALGFTAGIQRWVFDFETTPPSRLVPVGRYLLLPIGADARYALGKLSLFADGRFLLPLTVAQLGDRTPSGGKFGFNFALGAAFAFTHFFEVEVRGTYTLLSYSLPAVAGRPDQSGTVTDAYLVFGAGATFKN